MKTGRLQNKVIVVSGGTKGVGRAASEEFARQGAKVVIGGRDRTAGMNSVKLMKVYGSEGLFVYTDLLKIADCKKLFQKAYEKFGKVDGFFNYAGVTPISPLETCDEKTFDLVMDVNFKACFFCCQEAVKYMKLNHGGSIVLTGSPHAWGGDKDRAAYACSKGVLKTLMEHISHQFAADNIRCNYLTLGWTPTEGEVALRNENGESESELRMRASNILPMKRMCERTDFLEALVTMMSDASSMMSGSIVRITGGWYI